MMTRNRRTRLSPLETLSDLKSHIRRLKDGKITSAPTPPDSVSNSKADAQRPATDRSTPRLPS